MGGGGGGAVSVPPPPPPPMFISPASVCETDRSRVAGNSDCLSADTVTGRPV